MIYIVFAPPRSGKTFFCTRLAVDILENKKDTRRVFSNYPIITRSGKSSYRWEKKKVYENITDSVIIIDEAYRDYNSRQFKDFSVDEHTWFATNGHLNNDIYIIAQNPSRVDVVIREMCNEFIFVDKFHPWWIPFLNRPLWFRVLIYLDFDEFKMRMQPYYSQIQLFKQKYADAYDTHYYRTEEHGLHETWKEYLLINKLKEFFGIWQDIRMPELGVFDEHTKPDKKQFRKWREACSSAISRISGIRRV